MALNDNAVFTAAKGYVYVGTVGTASAPTPTTIAAFDEATGLGTGWTDLGHTSREDLPEFGFEGGDTETKGTWRNASLKEVITEVAVDYVVLTLQQFDDVALQLYYGVENASETEGEFAVADSSTATSKRALAIVMVDGDSKIGFYSPSASIRRDDSISLATDDFATLPIRATFTKTGTSNLFTWINADTLNQA